MCCYFIRHIKYNNIIGSDKLLYYSGVQQVNTFKAMRYFTDYILRTKNVQRNFIFKTIFFLSLLKSCPVHPFTSLTPKTQIVSTYVNNMKIQISYNKLEYAPTQHRWKVYFLCNSIHSLVLIYYLIVYVDSAIMRVIHNIYYWIFIYYLPILF